MLDANIVLAFKECHAVEPPEWPNSSSIAARHGVVRTTLSRHYARSIQAPRPPAARPDLSLLNEAQESVLMKRLDYMYSKKLYPTPCILHNMAKEIIGVLPSRNWATTFIKKHADKYKCIVVEGMERQRHAAEYGPVLRDTSIWYFFSFLNDFSPVIH